VRKINRECASSGERTRETIERIRRAEHGDCIKGSLVDVIDPPCLGAQKVPVLVIDLIVVIDSRRTETKDP